MTPAPGLQALEIRPGNPDFLDLPWSLPVGRWGERCARIVDETVRAFGGCDNWISE